MTTQIDEITAFLLEWASAEQSGDASRLDSYLADDFVGIGPLGFMLSKAEWMTRHVTGDLKYEAFQLAEMQARLYGTVAVVTAHQMARGSYRGHRIPTDLRATLVLIRPAGSWQLAVIHMSFIAGTPGAPPLPGQS